MPQRLHPTHDRGPTLLYRLVGLLRTVHPFPVLVVLVTSSILLVVASRGWPGWGLMLRAFGVVLMSQIAVGTMNDLHDRHADAVAQPDKPIPSGAVPASWAVALVVAALLALLPLALSLGPAAFALALLGTCAGLAYDVWLKPTPLGAGGYIVGFLALITWIWVVAGRFPPLFPLMYPAGALGLLAAHLANSYPDIESDATLGQRGLATLLGAQRTYRAILGLYATVCAGGLGLAIVERYALSVGLLLLAGALGAVAAIMCRSAPRDSRARERLFRLIAPGIGLLAAGSLLAVGA